MLTSGGKEFTGILYPILILATLFLNKKFLKPKKCTVPFDSEFSLLGNVATNLPTYVNNFYE